MVTLVSKTVVLLLMVFVSESAEAQLIGPLFRRVSRVSNFEFAVYSDGMLWGGMDQWDPATYTIGHWPRGTRHLVPFHYLNGIAFLARKGGRQLVSDANFVRRRDYLDPDVNTLTVIGNQTVPGRVGDPLAGYDSVFQGSGWRYVDAPDYIVYSSLDYDSVGIDISGSNYFDWPLRIVNGQRQYVTNLLARSNYPASFLSDEDMFTVFKDTDTRADPNYTGSSGPSMPIGIQFEMEILSWRNGPGKDIIILRYAITNKSGQQLDSCFIAFNPGLRISSIAFPQSAPTLVRRFTPEPDRNLTYVEPVPSSVWAEVWTATPYPPTLGYALLETPDGYTNSPVGLKTAYRTDTIYYFRNRFGQPTYFPYSEDATDSAVCGLITSPPPWISPIPYNSYSGISPLLLSGPFPMSPDQTVTYCVSFMFSDSLPHLLLMDDFVRRMHTNNFQRPVPPPPPRLTAIASNRVIRLLWDNSAESATDIMIPDSLGRPFLGYRLLRAVSRDGPFVEIGRWSQDSLLVHQFIDRGTDIGGLKNNVRYYYRILSFDEGAPRLKLDPMDCAAFEGVNSISVVPMSEPSNAASSPGVGMLLSGTLGEVSAPKLIPLNVTNYNTLFKDRAVVASLNTATDGVRYSLPVTLSDSLSGYVHNEVIDPGVFVHGTPATAGIKEGTVRIRDIFSLNAADVEFSYRFEQLADSFRILSPVLESTVGADVPVLIRDSLDILGVRTITPYTTSPREIIVEFLPGGIDTMDLQAGLIFEYMTVQLRDGATDSIITDHAFTSTGIKANGFFSIVMRPDHYYHTDTLANGDQWEFGHLLNIYESQIAFDFPDRGRGSGRPGLPFLWASGHRRGTVDFAIGDRVRIRWDGGRRGEFPRNAEVALTAGAPGTTEITDEMLEQIRIVPNPYMVRHEAQRGQPRIYFNYLPDECTIRIYTVALDLVKTIHHSGGSREEWDLTSEGGQLVASQLLVAHIEASNGKSTTKKFAVVIGR